MILRPPRSTLFPYTNALPIFLELDPRDDEDFDEELKRQTTVLGEVFDKQDEANELIEDFDASIERARKAYNGEDKAMGLITSAGRSEEHTSELQSRGHIVCRLLL